MNGVEFGVYSLLDISEDTLELGLLAFLMLHA